MTYVVEQLNKALDAHGRGDDRATQAFLTLALRDVKPPHYVEIARYIGHHTPPARIDAPIRKALAYAEAHNL
jgi:hypothetical protein